MTEAYSAGQQNDILLTSNALLDDLVRELVESPLDWDKIIEDTTYTRPYGRAVATGNVDGYITDGLLGEIHVEGVLRDCSEDWDGITLGLPIKPYTQTEHYTFHRSTPSHTWTVFAPGGMNITEYDSIAQFKGESEKDPDVLSVFEVKTGRKISAFSQEHITTIFTPLRELRDEIEGLPSHFAYAVALPYNQENTHQPDIIDFQQRGGLYVPLPIEKDAFNQKANEARQVIRSKIRSGR
jgi:hypothetical protein